MTPKTIVITGASSGIGAELARQLGAQGHRLVLAARSAAPLQAVADQVKGLAVPTDVTVRSQVEALRDAALKAFGGIDVWVNNAGQGISRNVLDMTDEDLDAMVSVNVKSALYGMQAIAPHFMAKNGGHIINISSFLARVPMAPQRSAYSAAKAALNSLTANLRMDLAVSHPGITVSVVMPGLVSTGFAEHARGAGPGAKPSNPPTPSQAPEAVAAAIVSLIAAPKGELVTSPGLVAAGQRYVADVDAFEAGLRQSQGGKP
jgi:short-subunit dehydrogenase